jgi:hypothetical protein
MNKIIKVGNPNTLPSIEQIKADPQKIAEDFYPRVFTDIASMSKEQLALILNGIACNAEIIEASWKFRAVQHGSEFYKGSECPSLSRIYAAMNEYKMLADSDDRRAELEQSSDHNSVSDDKICVVELSDGNIAIGYSTKHVARRKLISSNNQITITQSWTSQKMANPSLIENLVREKFALDRVDDDLFKSTFADVVSWILQIGENKRLSHVWSVK